MSNYIIRFAKNLAKFSFIIHSIISVIELFSVLLGYNVAITHYIGRFLYPDLPVSRATEYPNKSVLMTLLFTIIINGMIWGLIESIWLIPTNNFNSFTRLIINLVRVLVTFYGLIIRLVGVKELYKSIYNEVKPYTLFGLYYYAGIISETNSYIRKFIKFITRNKDESELDVTDESELDVTGYNSETYTLEESEIDELDTL
jgi:hypothetical protein